MKVVDLKTFLSYPNGVVFAEYTPCIMGDVRIRGGVFKADTLRGHAYQSFGLFDTEDGLVNVGDASPVVTDQFGRMGPGLKEDQLFVVLDYKDLGELIERLQRAQSEAKE